MKSKGSSLDLSVLWAVLQHTLKIANGTFLVQMMLMIMRRRRQIATV